LSIAISLLIKLQVNTAMLNFRNFAFLCLIGLALSFDELEDLTYYTETDPEVTPFGFICWSPVKCSGLLGRNANSRQFTAREDTKFELFTINNLKGLSFRIGDEAFK